MALMLSRGPSCLGVGTDLEGEKVYSAVIVFMHPRQELLTIKEGAGCLVATVEQSGSSLDVTVLCELPSHKHGRFYPSPINHAYLVLPYLAKKGKPKKLCLDLVMCYNCHLMVRRLHRWPGILGDLALLPPVFSRDPTAPILLPVGYISELWLNDIFNTPVEGGGSGLGKLCPTINRLACCRQEVVAGKTLVDWTEEERVVYPPATPAPKEDVANEPDNDADNDPADDDKSEHDDESDENATPKKEEDESEDESDDELKAPKDQTAVSRDSGLGASSSSHGISTGASVSTLVINPHVEHDTSMPLPTRLPSMQVLEELANNLYAYSSKLFQGLEETSMAMLDRILSGFKRLGGRAREYIHETAAIAINFLAGPGIWRWNWSRLRP